MKQPRRILFVLGGYKVGGLEKQLANLIAFRPESARDIEVHTLTMRPARSSDVARRFQEAGVLNTLVDRGSHTFPGFFLTLVRSMRQIRPAIVSTMLDSSVGAWGRLAAWLTRVPIIVHSDRLLATEGTRVHYILRPFLDRATTRFLPNAQAIADRLVADGVPPERIRVMHNGVDLHVFDPDGVKGSRDDWGVAATDTVLGYLGRFAPMKRVDLIIDALEQLPVAARPDHVMLAGDGSTLPQIRARIDADPWFREHCHLIGSIEDTPGFLSSIDYLVLPSESEGLPNVVLEAMAMARPVIATRVSDVPTLVGDTGLLIPSGDARALASAIETMQEIDPDERRALGRRARDRVEEEYDIVRSAERFWEAHLELLREREPMPSSS